MTDEEHAKNIRDRVKDLNYAIKSAEKDGICTVIQTGYTTEIEIREIRKEL